MKHLKIHFLGGVGTVTGSKFYLELEDYGILVDCGMFQGAKSLREENWKPLPIDVSKINTVLLTHGHFDHVGYLPLLVKQGFKGKVLGTAPTLEIAEIILKDSAKIQEEEAEKANKEGFSKHKPALPLYTIDEVEETLRFFKAIEPGKWIPLSPAGHKVRFRFNGHILGSTFIELDLHEKRFVFSGDLGRLQDDLLDAPIRPNWADYLFIESTYGNKNHPHEALESIFVDMVKHTIRKRSALIIPTFAVERLQSVMYLLWKLYDKNVIPNIPIFVDSPMGINVLEIFGRFPKWHKLSEKEYRNMCNHVHLVSSYAQTWETIDDPRPKIVIAGSGMVTGGRVLTYLKQLVDNPDTTVILVGFQAEGTRGRQLLEGAHEIKLMGKYCPVNATVLHLESLSAHADQQELLHWIDEIKNIPEKIFLVHGETTALDAFRTKIVDEKKWRCHIPQLHEIVTLAL
ncbi:MBL fold metallo-hydrolase RNA specificity domain-containing protein [Flagellimonas allohymeniacidonis]|uniref:MBL fold metallo-hydrolase n=1 Tax=Flagellimonas allohymeniacidonis TaxID=2517819 RepID=A0A4Q8QIZ8_9FLAO|nr:MBL fold metallo-hydrolase [Allomuricauda hymeniacidonis]TAI48429.1 MBL fold metallo-hydrolase [Allomuricauda hymeniacidonis]